MLASGIGGNNDKKADLFPVQPNESFDHGLQVAEVAVTNLKHVRPEAPIIGRALQIVAVVANVRQALNYLCPQYIARNEEIDSLQPLPTTTRCNPSIPKRSLNRVDE